MAMALLCRDGKEGNIIIDAFAYGTKVSILGTLFDDDDDDDDDEDEDEDGRT